ncbi:MAG: hypothetical protein ABL949_00990 [Fimbriimonadaceae bacterium]
MELTELKSAWQELDRKVEVAAQLNVRLARELHLDRTRNSLTRFKRTLGIELATAIPPILIAGSYASAHWAQITAQPLGGLPVLMLFGLSLTTIILSIRQLVTLSEIDYSGSVTSIQRALANLQLSRTKWTLGTFCIVLTGWMAFLVLVAQMLIGYEVYRKFGGPWLIGNFAFGLAVSAIVFLCQKPILESPRFQKFMADPRLAEACDHLHNLEAFVREDSA